MNAETPKKVILCCPTMKRPHDAFLEAVEASVPLMDAANIDHQITFTIGSSYISWARADLLRKALDTQPDAIVFLDHDMSWDPQDLVTLIETEGKVVAGTYRFKQDKVEYMGRWHTDEHGVPITREDGCIKADWIPAGFLKVTAEAVHEFMGAYPELLYGVRWRPHVDLFNHGAHEGTWWGEDFSFSRRWQAQGGDIWVVPDLNLNHHHEDKVYPGNLHKFLLRQPGGSDHIREVA